MDTIVQNLEHFGSSVQSKDGDIHTSNYVVQRYNLGEYKKSAFTSAAGNTVFFRGIWNSGGDLLMSVGI